MKTPDSNTPAPSAPSPGQPGPVADGSPATSQGAVDPAVVRRDLEAMFQRVGARLPRAPDAQDVSGGPAAP